MYSLTDCLTRTFHWLMRIRHRRGYGIHSPFAFQFVTGVIYEKGVYYAYAQLAQQFGKVCYLPAMRLKDYRLLFRLANFSHPQTCLLTGLSENPLACSYLRAGSVSTRYVDISELSDESEQPVLNMIVAANWETQAAELLHRLQPGGMMVVIGLKTRAQREAWHCLCQEAQAQVTFDLRDFGIVHYRPDLQRAHYVINYL